MNFDNKNYELLGKEFVEELNSTAYHLKHKKTKAEVLYIENGDEIKTFGIGFRTPPVDSTGVAHIVEHCVLSGSRKYRTKEPFMDMVNSSMQTFLNAMTYPDKTIYPIATRNEKDFYNLMDVYLDAVFYPRIQDVKEIFEQEGWHLELENPEDELKYNGVVYNEMRGAYSDADGQVYELLSYHLHPGSTYDHDSGGDPHEIINLTYENFIGFHKRYYHPSNSYIFLNGKMDVEKVLEYIDEEYLSDFDYQDPNSDIIMNEAFTGVKKLEDYYSVGKDDDIENKSYFAYGVDLGLSTSADDNFMRAILTDILIDSDSSILSDPLLESKLGEDYYSMTSSSLPLDLHIIAKGTDGEKLDEFINLIDTKLQEAVENGIDRDLIDATLNSYEFNLKELGMHRGVILGITALRGWLYGNSPLDSLKFKETLERIKSKIDDGFIENYIKEKILNNPQKIHLVVNPKPGMFQEKDEKVKEELAKYKESLSEDEINKLIENTNNLFEYQLQKDSKEDRDTIPKLQLEDISPGVRKLNVSEYERDGIKSFFTDEFTNEIYYTTFAFDLKNLTAEEIPYAGLIRDLLTSVDTENYGFKDLNNQIDIHTGGINFSTSTFEDNNSPEYAAVMTINGRATPDKIEKFLELLEEILLNSKFEDVNRIKDVLIMIKADLESNIEQSGHSLISSEVNSMMNDAIDLSNIMGGRKYLFFIRDIIEQLEENPDEVLRRFLTRNFY
ncbi:MAG: insulinase family protein [Neofamilia sp.]